MNVSTILAELSKSLGQEVVREACLSFANGTTPGGRVKKQKKERKPRGKSSWNIEVDTVRKEMMDAYKGEEPSEKAITYKMAYAEASRRRRLNNPDAEERYAKYKERMEERQVAKKAKKQASVVAPVAVPSPSPSSIQTTQVQSIAARICPECEDHVPALPGEKAGGDNSHRMCVVRGMKSGKWRTPSDWEVACKAEGERREQIQQAESASRTVEDATTAATAEPKKRGRPAKKAGNA